MLNYLGIWLVLFSFTVRPLRAATEPHAVRAPKPSATWTNEDLERLGKVPGLISVVGQPAGGGLQVVSVAETQPKTYDFARYAAQAASVRSRLEEEQAELRNFTEAVEDARERKATTHGINMLEGEIGLTPETTIDILQGRVRETQGELDALEELARQNDIPPGVLRRQWQGVGEATQ